MILRRSSAALISYLRDPGDGDGHAVGGVHVGGLDDDGERAQGYAVNLLKSWEDDGRAAGDDLRFAAVPHA